MPRYGHQSVEQEPRFMIARQKETLPLLLQLPALYAVPVARFLCFVLEENFHLNLVDA